MTENIVEVGMKVKITNPNIDFENKFEFNRFPKNSICTIKRIIEFDDMDKFYGLCCEDEAFEGKTFYYLRNEFEFVNE